MPASIVSVVKRLPGVLVVPFQPVGEGIVGHQLRVLRVGVDHSHIGVAIGEIGVVGIAGVFAELEVSHAVVVDLPVDVPAAVNARGESVIAPNLCHLVRGVDRCAPGRPWGSASPSYRLQRR